MDKALCKSCGQRHNSWEPHVLPKPAKVEVSAAHHPTVQALAEAQGVPAEALLAEHRRMVECPQCGNRFPVKPLTGAERQRAWRRAQKEKG